MPAPYMPACTTATASVLMRAGSALCDWLTCLCDDAFAHCCSLQAMLAKADISGVWATLQNPPHWVLGAAAIGGATLGLILHLGLGTCQVADPPEAAAKKSE